MNTLGRGLLASGLLIACHAADAFGPKTHLWIGSQVLGNLGGECRIQLVSRTYQVTRDRCQAILSNRESFHAGVLGPDIYPDLISGQNTVHSGVKDGWVTADFLEHIVSSASTPPSAAYAAGYLVHAASDVFGHSYVNAYAGDIWNLHEARAVELRHIVIEKYIDAHLPALPSDAMTFRAPAEFVRDTLVHNNRTQAQYQRAASHLASMTSVKTRVEDLAARTESITSTISNLLAQSVESGVTLAGQLLDGEAALAVASAALEVPKAAAVAQRAVLDAARKAADDTANALMRHEKKLTELGTVAQAQQLQAAAANSAAQQAKAAANQLRAHLSELENQIQSVPPKIVAGVCQSVTDPLCNTVCPESSSNPLCIVCNVPREVCTTVERVNDEYQSLNNQITSDKQRLGELESAAVAETAKANAANANAAVILQQKATEAAAGPGIAAAEAAAEATYHAADEQYQSTESTVASIQQQVDELRGKVEEIRKDLIDAKALAGELRKFANQLNLLSHLFHNWQAGIDHAGSAFVRTSDRIGRGMVDGRRHLFSEYARWLACEGAVYLAEPYQVADVPCSAQTAAQELQVLMHDMTNAILPDPLKGIHGQFDDLRSKIDIELRGALTVAARELVRFVSDQTTADFVELLVNPQNVTRARLNETLATAGDGNEKDILVFDNGADLIDRDIGLKNDTLDPKEFAALLSAVTLAKLSLLDQAEMRRMVLEIGGTDAMAAYDDGKFDVGKSILLTAARSLDGNEQWQPYGLLYPRSSGGGAPANAFDRQYGFGPRDEARHGFSLFIDPVLRDRVFLKLFPKQIHGELAKRPEMAADRYAFPICDQNAFPVTFLPSGDPATVDKGCSVQPPAD